MAQKYVSKRDNEDFLEKLYAIGSATDVNDSRMRNILEVLSLVWAQFPVADRNWDEECRANGWEMPNQPLPRTGAIWTEAELVHARTMLKSKPLAEVAQILGRSTGAVERIAKTAPSHLRTEPSPAFIGIRPAKNQPLRPPPRLQQQAVNENDE